MRWRMFMLHKKVLFLSVFLIACQPSYNSPNTFEKPSQTGAEKIIVTKNKDNKVTSITAVPYTASGNNEAFKELKQQVKDIPTNPELINNLRTIEVDPMKYNHGASLTNTQSKPDVVILKYILAGNNKITFTVPLEPNSIGFYKGMDPIVESNTHQLARATAENQKNYEVQLQCLDTDCKSIKFILVKKQDSKVLSGVGVKFSQKKVPMSVDSSQNQKNFVQHLLTPSGKELLKRDYNIVNGPSFSEVWMNVQDNRILYFKTDLAFTGNTAIPISNVYLSKPKKSGQRIEYYNQSVATGELIGNDEERGDIWVNFKLNEKFYEITNTQKQSSTAEFAITTGNDDTALVVNTPPETDSENSYFQIKNSEAKNMSQLLSRYKNQYGNNVYEYIQAYIDIYTGRYNGKHKTFKQKQCGKSVTTNERSKLQSFYNNMYPALPHIQKQFESVGVAPEFSLLTVIESNYPENYKIEKAYCKAPKKCSAYGPFQIINSTANYLLSLAKNYRVSTSGLQATTNPSNNRSDYRNYLLPSSKMAAVYIKYFSHLLSNDRPELYAVAYNGGPGRVKNDENKDSPKYLNYKTTTLEKLARFKPPKSCEQGFIDYGFKFLALKLISDNYKAYGFKLNPKQFSNFYQMNQAMKLQPQSI